MQALRAQRRYKGAPILWAGLTVIAALAVGVYFFKSLYLALAILVTYLVVTIWADIVDRLEQAEYAALPGAVDAQGNHHCVFCGHQGITQRTTKSSNWTISACSHCKEPLYVD